MGRREAIKAAVLSLLVCLAAQAAPAPVYKAKPPRRLKARVGLVFTYHGMKMRLTDLNGPWYTYESIPPGVGFIPIAMFFRGIPMNRIHHDEVQKHLDENPERD